MRGAWVEIFYGRTQSEALASLPVRGAWVEMSSVGFRSQKRKPSLPVRGAWVEISLPSATAAASVVAPRAGSVG
mgnify:CR=1 FL=1